MSTWSTAPPPREASPEPYKDDDEKEPLTPSASPSPASTSTDGLHLADHGWSASPPAAPRRYWVIAVAVAAVFGIVTGVQGADWAAKRAGRNQTAPGHVAGLWTEYGSSKDSVVGTMPPGKDDLPICERTLLIDWGSFFYGFGSTTTTVVQAAYFAKIHNYTLLFTRDANNYGTYLDFFRPAPLDCYAPEELYSGGPQSHGPPYTGLSGLLQGNQTWVQSPDLTQVPHLVVQRNDILPINTYLQRFFWDMDTIQAAIPVLDAHSPLPLEDQVPPFFQRWFTQYSALFSEHFSFNAKMEVKVSKLRHELKLDDQDRALTAGVHFRGGDKLALECFGGTYLSCGNITQHCETAYLALDPVRLAETTQKPRLLLMTTEPDIPDKFKTDAYCSDKFSVGLMPAGAREEKEGKAFKQYDFNVLPPEVRLEDTQNMLAEADILANHVDGTAVALMSNLGRVIYTRAGAQRVAEGRMRSVDVYWFPTQFPPFKASAQRPGCIGNDGCYPG